MRIQPSVDATLPVVMGVNQWPLLLPDAADS